MTTHCDQFGEAHKTLSEFEIDIGDCTEDVETLKGLRQKLLDGGDVREVLLEMLAIEIRLGEATLAGLRAEREELVAHFREHHGYVEPKSG